MKTSLTVPAGPSGFTEFCRGSVQLFCAGHVALTGFAIFVVVLLSIAGYSADQEAQMRTTAAQFGVSVAFMTVLLLFFGVLTCIPSMLAFVLLEDSRIRTLAACKAAREKVSTGDDLGQ